MRIALDRWTHNRHMLHYRNVFSLIRAIQEFLLQSELPFAIYCHFITDTIDFHDIYYKSNQLRIDIYYKSNRQIINFAKNMMWLDHRVDNEYLEIFSQADCSLRPTYSTIGANLMSLISEPFGSQISQTSFANICIFTFWNIRSKWLSIDQMSFQTLANTNCHTRLIRI